MSKNKNKTWKDKPAFAPFTPEVDNYDKPPVEMTPVEEVIEEQEPVSEKSGPAARQLVETTDVEAAKPKSGNCPGCGQGYADEPVGKKLRCVNCSINVTLK